MNSFIRISNCRTKAKSRKINVNYNSMFSMFPSFRLLLVTTLLLFLLTGCVVLAVADAAVTTAATAAKVTVKAVGAIADTVIPDSKEKEKDTDPNQ